MVFIDIAMNKPPLGIIYSPGWISGVGDHFLSLGRVLEIPGRARQEVRAIVSMGLAIWTAGIDRSGVYPLENHKQGG